MYFLALEATSAGLGSSTNGAFLANLKWCKAFRASEQPRFWYALPRLSRRMFKSLFFSAPSKREMARSKSLRSWASRPRSSNRRCASVMFAKVSAAVGFVKKKDVYPIKETEDGKTGSNHTLAI